jgi:hypothetical protein
VGKIVGALAMADGSILFTSLVDHRRSGDSQSNTRLALRRVSREGILSTIRPENRAVAWWAQSYTTPEGPLAMGVDGSVFVGSE